MHDSAIKKKYEGSRILVTGGAGFIGSNLVKTLLDLNSEEITVIDDLSSSFERNAPSDQRVTFLNGSITDDGILSKFPEEIDYIFHLAAFFANQNSVEHPDEDLATNGLGTLKILRAASHLQFKRFVYTSSSAVYGSQETFPLMEDHLELKHDTPYQITKLLGELYCNYFHKMHSLPFCILRIFNVYGPRDIPGTYRNMITNFVHQALSRKPLRVTGDGDESRNFTYVDDVIEALLVAGIEEKAIGETINIGSAKESSTLEVASMINEMTGNKSGLKFSPRRSWDHSLRKVPSLKKAKDILAFEAEVSIRDGLKKTIDWQHENMDKINQHAKF